MKIDEFDNKILDCLKKNARMSYRDIGEEIGLTSPAVAQRIQKLESLGVIEGYTVKLNERKLGHDIKAIITLKTTFGRYQVFAKEFDYQNSDEIISFHRVTGDDCAILYTKFRDNQHLIDFLDKLTLYGDTKTNIILEEKK